MKKLYTLFFLMLCASFTFAQDIIINEFHADIDPGFGDANGDGIVHPEQDEFVELYNNSGTAIDISGWTVSDFVQVRHVFPAGSILSAGGFATVFAGGVPTGIPGDIVNVSSTGILGFSNNGDVINIADPNGVIITSYSYGDEGGNNRALGRNPDFTGAFMEHIDIPMTGRYFSPGGMNLTGINTCNTPTNVTVDLGMDPNRVTISWDPSFDATLYQVRYRRALTTAWTNLTTTSTSRVVQVLTQNKVYDYRVRARCTDGSWTDMTPIQKFRTVPCLTPENFVSIQLNNNKVRLEWTDYIYADKYQIFFRLAGSSDNYTKMVTYYDGMNFRVLNNLTPGAEYEYKVRSWCEVSYGPFSEDGFFTNMSPRKANFDFEVGNVYPNPTSNELNIDFNLDQKSDVTFSITDLLGRQVSQMTNSFGEGVNRATLNVQDLNQGHYMVRITNGEKVAVKQFTKK